MSAVEIFFSPTGGTEKAADAIATAWEDKPTRIDLCDPKADFAKCAIDAGDQVVIAAPAFGGRVPEVAVERLQKIAGNGACCTVVAVYGNRAYDDTLVELQDVAEKCGFTVVAAIGAVAQHSICPQYATNRPDAQDVEQLRGFAKQIADKTTAVASVPGNRPYKKAGAAGLVPKPISACVKCGLCAKDCPVQAIDPATMLARKDTCISCMRCVARCPHDARHASKVMTKAVGAALKKACSERKDNELHL